MATKRRRPNGSIELRIVHPRLSKPYYSTHATEAEADAYTALLIPMLDRGDVPAELQAATPSHKPVAVSVVIKNYLDDSTAAIAKSDLPMLAWLRSHIKINVDEVTVQWTGRWITGMKRLEKLAPGTIRKRVESLARVIDWWHRKNHGDGQLPANPLRTLPVGYSSYTEADGLAAGQVRHDEERMRRLEEGEHERIEAALAGVKFDGHQRPLADKDRDALLLLYRLIVNTGLRLSEAYSLQWKHIGFKDRTIYVQKSKTGSTRVVPMTKEVYAWLDAVKSVDTNAFVFPFWDGKEGKEKVTRRLSQRFATLFSYCGSRNLTEHDLRHEATCRWILMRDKSGGWMFRESEVKKITGHKTDRVFQRYLSLRGSDLSARLW